jgi:hypothetical protein
MIISSGSINQEGQSLGFLPGGLRDRRAGGRASKNAQSAPAARQLLFCSFLRRLRGKNGERNTAAHISTLFPSGIH